MYVWVGSGSLEEACRRLGNMFGVQLDPEDVQGKVQWLRDNGVVLQPLS